MEDKPNIILLFPDQHRGDALGCLRLTGAITPNLDHLASEGVLFERCYTNSPLCMPARTSLMNGRYVCEHGIWANGVFNADCQDPSFVRNIKDAGYHTCAFGKLHLYEHDSEKPYVMDDYIPYYHKWGFEEVHEYYSGTAASCIGDSAYTQHLAERGLADDYRKYLAAYIRSYYAPATYSRFPQSLMALVDQGDGSDSHLQRRIWAEPPSSLPAKDHLDSFTGKKAKEWIKTYDGKKPFFLMVGFPGPHDPYDSLLEYRAMYHPDKLAAGITGRPDPPISSLVQKKLKDVDLEAMTAEQKKQLWIQYFGKISLIDAHIGELVTALKEKGIYDNTWIIYTSDHGEMLGDHGLLGKRVFYEEAVHIPLIIRPPQGSTGRRYRGLTDCFDVTATLLDVAGAEPLEQIHGKSLLPVVHQPATTGAQSPPGKEAVFSEVLGYSMLRTSRYKLIIETRSGKMEALYDMAEDPHELNNLIFDPSSQGVYNTLMERHFTQLLDRFDEEKLETFSNSWKQKTKYSA